METADSALDRGRDLERAGKLEEALGAYEAALALESASLAALTAIPLLQHRLDRIEAAALSYRRYLAIDPLGVGFVINLANMLMQEGDEEGAWTAMIDYFNAGGTDPYAVANAAYLAENFGRADIARSIAYSIMERRPNDLITVAACADIAGLLADPVGAVRYAGLAERLDATVRLSSKRLNIPNYG